MSFLPAPFEDGNSLTQRQEAQASARTGGRCAGRVPPRLGARTLAEYDRIDSQALGDASRASLAEEFETLDWGLEHANGSAAKVELVHRKHLEIQSAINNRRTARRFGG